MKITRAPSLPQSGSAAKASAVGRASGRSFAAKLAGAERATGKTKGPGRPDKAIGPSSMSDIGADLKAGKLTPKAAIDRVVERVIDRQLGKTAPAAMRAQLAMVLRETLADDPLLAAKVRSLGRD